MMHVSKDFVTRPKIALTFALCLMPLLAQAGADDTKTVTVPPTPPAEEPFVTGELTVNYDTHFISYGRDVWQIGDNWDKALVHPYLELDFHLLPSLQFYVSTWMDINNFADSSIGKNIQEVDVNAGFYYTLDKFKFQLGYGAWNYASQTESVLETKVTYTDGLINPFINLHSRLAIGSNIGLATGVVPQVGIAPSIPLGIVSVTFPVVVSFETNDYHGGDGGFGFVSAGIMTNTQLAKHLVLNLGATYYHTNSAVEALNPKSNFVTGRAGFTIPF